MISTVDGFEGLLSLAFGIDGLQPAAALLLQNWHEK
jgi:hypothetical protein